MIEKGPQWFYNVLKRSKMSQNDIRLVRKGVLMNNHFDKPFIEGCEIKSILTNLGLPKSRAKAIYHDIRQNYVEDAKRKNVIIFGNQVPTTFVLDYFQRIGITKDYLLSKVS